MLPGVVGLIQATEVLKYLLGKGKPLVGRLMLYDAMKMSFKDVRIRRDPACALCGDSPTITELIDYKAFCEIPMPVSQKKEAAEDFNEADYAIEAPELEEILEEGDENVVLVDVREPHEWDICRIENATMIALSEFDQHINELNPENDIYLYCYKGIRSMTALKKLKQAGFKNLKSLTGGIDRWAEIVDPSMPRY